MGGIRKKFGHLIIWPIIFSILLNPVFSLQSIPKAKAEDDNSQAANEEEPVSDVAYDGSTITEMQPENNDANLIKMPLDETPAYTGQDFLIQTIASLHTEEDRQSGIGLDEVFSNQTQPRIILNTTDLASLKILWRLSGRSLMPDFDREPQAVLSEYPSFREKLLEEKPELFEEINSLLGHEINTQEDILTIKVGRYDLFLDLIHFAQVAWSDKMADKDVVALIENQIKDALANHSLPDLKLIGILADVSGRDQEEVKAIISDLINPAFASDSEFLSDAKDRFNDIMADYKQGAKSAKLDIRVINLLVYLVTPKTQGGAGHWRIKVKRIFAGYNTENNIYSRESEQIYGTGVANDLDKNVTAADWGQGRETSNSSPQAYLYDEDKDQNNSFATIYDNNGDEFDALINKAKAAESNSEEEGERNISAHADGQAVDISEVDDIRCTLIKRTRVGKVSVGVGAYGVDSDEGRNRSKFTQRPIKLAWQTSKGYAESGAGDYYQTDMANVLKSFATQSIKDLVEDFGGNLEDYDGDLSQANFSDIAVLLGKSIFSEIINSPGTNMAGYQFGDTLETLGGMYFADYLGLPREIFAQGNRYDSYEEIAQAIGAAAVETRLKIPIGTFDGNTLDEMLIKAGQRKIEYEMNLNAGSLDKYFATISENSANIENKQYLIGKAVIEKELNLRDGSYSGENNAPPANFDELKRSIGSTKANIVFRDSAYVDNTLHIELGTCDKLKNGQMSPLQFAQLVGRIRLDDTLYGLQYMASAFKMYGLDEATYTNILNGQKEALIAVGIRMFSEVFANTADQKEALAVWIANNRAKDPASPDACVWGNPEKAHIYDGTPQAKDIEIDEAKAIGAGLRQGDLFNLLGCPSSNPRSVFQSIGTKVISYAIAQQYLTPEQKVKFNLTEVNPTLHSTNPDKQFYVERIYRIPEILERIKNNWREDNRDPEYVRIKNLVSGSIDGISTTFNNSMPITSVSDAKAFVRNIAVEINKLNSDVQQIRGGSNRYINKVNGTIIDIDELLHIMSELAEGKALPSTNHLTINQIPSNIFTVRNDTGSIAALNNQQLQGATSGTSSAHNRDNVLTKSGFAPNRAALMALFARKVNPKDFFIILAAEKVENSLELPQNSLVYFVQNYEKKGLGKKESFLSAVGQAEIENTFGMPSHYFEGPLLNDAALEKPDFQNDLRALAIYGDGDIDTIAPITVARSGNSFTAFALDQYELSPRTKITNPLNQRIIDEPDNFDFFNAEGGVDNYQSLTADQQQTVMEEARITELSWLKIHDKTTFDYLVQRAEQRYQTQIKQFIDNLSISSKELEISIDDVVENVRIHKFNEAIRSPEQDLLFRMGIPGGLDGLKTGNDIAWADSYKRAEQIDSMFKLEKGTTKALFTGERINSGINRISNKDKQLLVAKMQISPLALELLMRYINGEVPLSMLEEKAAAVTNIGDNPYYDIAPPDGDDDQCASGFSEVSGQLIANTYVRNGWFYFDADSPARGKPLIFGSREQGEEYAKAHADRQVTYIEEIALGLEKITGLSNDYLKESLLQFLRGEKENVLAQGEGIAAIESNLNVSKGTFDKLFTRAETSDFSRPLVAYKRAVGNKVINKLITGRIFASLGLKVDPSLFTVDDFMEIMQGNFSVMWNVAGSLIDRELGLPQGSILSVLTAKTTRLRMCAMSEIGGNILGRMIGLDYVSLKGNIYKNIGRSKLEKVLGLPRNSFVGTNTEQLMKNIGPANFVIAFKYPLNDVNLNDAMNAFFDRNYVRSIESYSNSYKIQKIRDFLELNSALLSGSRKTALDNLNNALIQQVLTTAEKSVDPDGDWRHERYGSEKKEDVDAFIRHIDGLDSMFGLTRGTTARMLSRHQAANYKTYTISCGVQPVMRESTDPANPGLVADYEARNDPDDPGNTSKLHWSSCVDVSPGNDYIYVDEYDDTSAGEYQNGGDIATMTTFRAPNGGTCDCQDNYYSQPSYTYEYNEYSAVLTPDLYLQKISTKTVTSISLMGAMDLFGFDLTDTQKQAVVGFITNYNNFVKYSEGRAEIYNALSTIFSLHLDEKAGVDEGTIRNLIAHPENAGDILWTQAAKRLDQAFGTDSSARWSFSGVYQRYFNDTAGYQNSTPQNKLEECPDQQAQIEAFEAESGIRDEQEEINNWIDQHGGYTTWASRDGTSAGEYGVDIRFEPGYMDMVNKQKSINERRQDFQNSLTTCRTYNRGAGNDSTIFINPRGFPHRPLDWHSAWTIFTDYASDKISEKIYETTKQTILMPTEDIKKFFVNGDMRYFIAALTTYSLNTTMTWVTGSEDTVAVPDVYKISYDLVKLWIVGDSSAESYASQLAAANFYTDPDSRKNYDDTMVPATLGDLYNGERNFWGILGSQDFWVNRSNSGGYHSNPPPPASDYNSQVNFNKQQSQIIYGDHDVSGIDAVVADTKAGAVDCQGKMTEIINRPQYSGSIADRTNQAFSDTATVEFTSTVSGTQINHSVSEYMATCRDMITEYDDLNLTMANARSAVHKRFEKSLMFRTFDQYLWSKDKNVYPGFSQAIIEGGLNEKYFALGQYIKNGLHNHEFFGHNIAWFQRFEERTGLSMAEWGSIVSFGNELFGSMPADQVLARFYTGGAYNSFAKFITNHSENWFGFKINDSYAKAAITGLTTGHWGLSLSPHEHTIYDPRNGQAITMPTFGSVFKDAAVGYLSNEVFKWADKRLGWKPGTSQKVYEVGKIVYDKVTDLRLIANYDAISQRQIEAIASGNQPAIDAATAQKNAFIDKHADVAEKCQSKGSDAVKTETLQAIGTYISSVISNEITEAIMKTWGEEIANFEQKHALTPGSTSTVIGGVVSYAVGTVLHAIAPALFPAMGPAGLGLAVVMFVGMNLFGVYKSDIKCSPDGYYPEMESPSEAVDSDSGILIWDGTSEDQNEKNYIASAQYKAKRLILDALEMHNNPIYKDTFPSQIMTGRNDDAIAVNDSITYNMCRIIDENMVAIAGICGGNTRAGVWGNPQTTTYTHIGF